MKTNWSEKQIQLLTDYLKNRIDGGRNLHSDLFFKDVVEGLLQLVDEQEKNHETRL